MCIFTQHVGGADVKLTVENVVYDLSGLFRCNEQLCCMVLTVQFKAHFWLTFCIRKPSKYTDSHIHSQSLLIAFMSNLGGKQMTLDVICDFIYWQCQIKLSFIHFFPPNMALYYILVMNSVIPLVRSPVNIWQYISVYFLHHMVRTDLDCAIWLYLLLKWARWQTTIQ